VTHVPVFHVNATMSSKEYAGSQTRVLKWKIMSSGRSRAGLGFFTAITTYLQEASCNPLSICILWKNNTSFLTNQLLNKLACILKKTNWLVDLDVTLGRNSEGPAEI
jgi:hypothetical protein